MIKHGRQSFALATGHEIVSAGLALLTQCVLDRNGQGGIATNIGTFARRKAIKPAPLVDDLSFPNTLWA